MHGKKKTVLSAASTNALKTKEIIYTNERTYSKFSDERKQVIEYNFAEQMTIFDYMKKQ